MPRIAATGVSTCGLRTPPVALPFASSTSALVGVLTVVRYWRGGRRRAAPHPLLEVRAALPARPSGEGPSSRAGRTAAGCPAAVRSSDSASRSNSCCAARCLSSPVVELADAERVHVGVRAARRLPLPEDARVRLPGRARVGLGLQHEHRASCPCGSAVGPGSRSRQGRRPRDRRTQRRAVRAAAVHVVAVVDVVQRVRARRCR